MKAISLWQPWATAIAIGAKTIETRSWKTPYRGPLAIHAARTKLHLNYFDLPSWDGELDAGAALANAGYRQPADYPLGAIVAVGHLATVLPTEEIRDRIGAMEMAFGNYAGGRFGWVLHDIRKLREPLPWRGSQGFFEVPDDLIAQRLPQAA